MSRKYTPGMVTRQQIMSALDVVTQMSRLNDGVRRVTCITEIVGMAVCGADGSNDDSAWGGLLGPSQATASRTTPRMGLKRDIAGNLPHRPTVAGAWAVPCPSLGVN